MSEADAQERLADRIAHRASAGNRTVGVVESLTGGMIASALARAPSASDWFRGSLVAYGSEVKHDLVGVPAGPVVSADAVEIMARWACSRLGADVAVAVSGVGGPGSQDGEPPGTVYCALACSGVTRKVERHDLGARPTAEICGWTTEHALLMILNGLTERGQEG